MTYHGHTAPNGEYVASDDDPHTDWGVTDLRPYLEAHGQAVSALVDLMLPEKDPPLCRQEIPAEGTE